MYRRVVCAILIRGPFDTRARPIGERPTENRRRRHNINNNNTVNIAVPVENELLRARTTKNLDVRTFGFSSVYLSLRNKRTADGQNTDGISAEATDRVR